ncbi:MAG: sugar phosphate isomerase/epimerase [archaeon]|nr:sugar phosphate isomerase/epimerase [archaeon]
MKIGLNTYSFRKEIGKGKYTLEQVWEITNKIGYIEGIELLDRHIPGWPDGDLDKGIKQVIEQIKPYNWNIYALGPHVKLYRKNQKLLDAEIIDAKRWIDLAAGNKISSIRVQVGGPFGIIFKKKPQKHIQIVKNLMDQVIPYAEEKKVRISIETHHGLSSWPPFIKEITENYKDSKALGIIFDWGNFLNNEDRYGALEISANPQNHAHNHVKIFHFGENFQEIKYDSLKIVNAFKEANFQDYFSIEFEGFQDTLEGIYKSVHALKYAISEGEHKIDYDFDWKTLAP